MAQTIAHVQQIAGDNAANIRVINGETGWPTGKMKLKAGELTAFANAC